MKALWFTNVLLLTAIFLDKELLNLSLARSQVASFLGMGHRLPMFV